ncbi:ExbD/TolR family protein [Malaciobacter mytili]|uniref:Biopolymer transporter ExbD n=1 Tax=Malaciobacter mytili LMG 24559 TaxID=1032238 RepID=A0AAX2ADF3_9BACT|nr:biopolymer transporter ExbD [Malaciobacter mytili]AXH14025.1 TonB system transport protein ExbD [Malaciobacter mytili LMG 24559]RXI43377.1 biopolymer transporter ExbD [Malaciobacter mytili]RXK15069.1 biopolymer transporter ExbD [Malaciobacter mytili LMG 24559]
MRRFSHKNNKEETEINLTPMLDVVFIMLIFFIVTTSFVKEAGIDVNRPSAKTSQQKSNANILIAIKNNDEIWIDKRMVDLRAVRSNIERLKASNSQNSVVVQSDKDAKTGVLVKVMDQVRLAGITNISISTLKN